MSYSYQMMRVRDNEIVGKWSDKGGQDKECFGHVVSHQNMRVLRI
jgi:hypothetical protein